MCPLPFIPCLSLDSPALPITDTAPASSALLRWTFCYGKSPGRLWEFDLTWEFIRPKPCFLPASNEPLQGILSVFPGFEEDNCKPWQLLGGFSNVSVIHPFSWVFSCIYSQRLLKNLPWWWERKALRKTMALLLLQRMMKGGRENQPGQGTIQLCLSSS